MGARTVVVVFIAYRTLIPSFSFSYNNNINIFLVVSPTVRTSAKAAAAAEHHRRINILSDSAGGRGARRECDGGVEKNR